jgi:hypothetical protein
MGFNILITPLFWIWLKPNIPKMKPWDTFIMDVHHVFPIIASVANLVLNNQYFLKMNAKRCFYAGIHYMIVNALGSYLSKQAIYPFPCDWSNRLVSVATYGFQAVILYLIQMQLARYTQRVFKNK